MGLGGSSHPFLHHSFLFRGGRLSMISLNKPVLPVLGSFSELVAIHTAVTLVCLWNELSPDPPTWPSSLLSNSTICFLKCLYHFVFLSAMNKFGLFHSYFVALCCQMF